MRIDVTQEDIRRGEQGVCHKCPIALAMERAGLIGNVKTQCVWVNGRCLPLPASAIMFIRNFDYNRSGDPFSFDINVTDTAIIPTAAITRAGAEAAHEAS